eukprot:scaffold4.g4937.t1
MSLPVERPEDCPTRIGLAAGAGFVAGAIFGAVTSNWGDIPQVVRDKPWPALVRTGSVMAAYGSTLALVGAAFATVDCFAETVRGKKDWVNGCLGSAAAGAMVGLRVGRLPVAVGAAAAMAAVSAVVDASDGHLIGKGLVDDGATPPRRVYPWTAPRQQRQQRQRQRLPPPRARQAGGSRDDDQPGTPYSAWYGSNQAKELSEIMIDPQEESLVDDAYNPLGSLDPLSGGESDFLAEDYEDPSSQMFGGPLRSTQSNLEAELPPGDYSTFRQRQVTSSSGFNPDLQSMQKLADPDAWRLSDEQEAMRLFQREKSVDEALLLSSRQLEAAVNRYAVALWHGSTMQQIEDEDVAEAREQRGDGVYLEPSWIRASRRIAESFDVLNEQQRLSERMASEATLQRGLAEIEDEALRMERYELELEAATQAARQPAGHLGAPPPGEGAAAGLASAAGEEEAAEEEAALFEGTLPGTSGWDENALLEAILPGAGEQLAAYSGYVLGAGAAAAPLASTSDDDDDGSGGDEEAEGEEAREEEGQGSLDELDLIEDPLSAILLAHTEREAEEEAGGDFAAAEPERAEGDKPLAGPEAVNLEVEFDRDDAPTLDSKLLQELHNPPKAEPLGREVDLESEFDRDDPEMVDRASLFEAPDMEDASDNPEGTMAGNVDMFTGDKAGPEDVGKYRETGARPEQVKSA